MEGRRSVENFRSSKGTTQGINELDIAEDAPYQDMVYHKKILDQRVGGADTKGFNTERENITTARTNNSREMKMRSSNGLSYYQVSSSMTNFLPKIRL